MNVIQKFTIIGQTRTRKEGPLIENNIDLNDVVLYNSKDIQRLFQCGINQTYELLHTRGFPTITIGRKMYVEKKAFEKWIISNQGKKVFK